MKTTLGTAIVNSLQEEGIQQAFGMTGSHLLSFFSAMKDSSIKYVSVKHEAAAAFMALNYTRIAQKPALILATAGPGAANLINGVTDLFKTQLPAFILTPTVSTGSFGKNAFQEDSGYGSGYSVNQLFQPVTKRSVLLVNAKFALEQLRDLFRQALTPPYGPVHLCVPADLFATEIEYEMISPARYRLTNDQRTEHSKIKMAAREILSAQAPAILIGGRCMYPDCSEQLSILAAQAQAPVITSLMAKGIFDESSSLFAGVIDYFGHRSAEKVLKNSDLIVSFGFDFTESETLKYDPDLFQNAKLISCDCVDSYLGTNYPIDIGIAGSLPSTITALTSELNDIGYKSKWNSAELEASIRDFNAYQISQMNDGSTPLSVPYILSEFSKHLKDAITFTDGSAIGVSCSRHFQACKRAYFPYGAACSIGQGVSGVIGGAIASPGMPVFCLTGDGAFLMHGSEVLTALQYRIGITWVIFKDGLYNMVDINQKMSNANALNFCTTFVNPDFKYLAQAYGAQYFEINDSLDIKVSIASSKDFNRKNQCAMIIVNYNCNEHLPIKPRLVETMRDLGQTKDIAANPFLMRAFKKAIREKV